MKATILADITTDQWQREFKEMELLAVQAMSDILLKKAPPCNLISFRDSCLQLARYTDRLAMLFFLVEDEK